MNAAIIYQVPVNNSLPKKSWLWDIFTHVILGKHTTYESVLEHLCYLLHSKRDWGLIINTQLTFKNIWFSTWLFPKFWCLKYIYFLFKEKILSWKQEPLCRAKMAMCIDWIWFKFIWAKQWNWNTAWNQTANLLLTEVLVQFPQICH